ncbi:MAG: ribosome small subunit-dependent GTPase A [Leptospira sp.]|nr:ribosome small subunit-dependent GTPase A [Leptospira sp.]
MNSYLYSLGFNERLEAEANKYNKIDLLPGRVFSENKNYFNVMTEKGEIISELSGKFLFNTESKSDFPSVGDWVLISPYDNDRKGIIHILLPRKSWISRKNPGEKSEEQIICANIDLVLIVTGLDGNYNLRRIERYLAMARENRTEPVIILNKTDLCSDLEIKLEEVQSVAINTPIVCLNSLTLSGYERLKTFFTDGITAAFVGSSGAGKSTIINNLIESNEFKTREVRENDSRGRHTTTRRQMILLKSGGLVIDNPGLRELQLWDSESGLSDSFRDINDLSSNCYYKDCSHNSEPGCAVRIAIEDGDLDQNRLNNFQKMKRELSFLESRTDEKKKIDRKLKERKFQKKLRERLKDKYGNR